MIVKLQWKLKKSTEPLSPWKCQRYFPRLRDGKGQQEIFEKRRMGIRGVQLRPRIRQVHGRCQKPFRLRIRLPYASEGEGLHFPPVPEALNRCVLRKQVPGATPPSDTIKQAAPTFSSV
jgi:hypothetical protein